MHEFNVKVIKKIMEIINEELVTLKKNGMNTSVNKYDSIENIIFKENLKITSIGFSISLDKMYVQLSNDHSFVVSTRMYKRLTNVSEKSIKNYQIIANGTGIHWPDLDEDLSLKGFFKDFLVQQIYSEKELILIDQ